MHQDAMLTMSDLDKAPPKKKQKRVVADGDADAALKNGNGTHEENSEEEEEEFDEEGEEDDEGEEEEGEEDAVDEAPTKAVKVSAAAKATEAGDKEAVAAGGDEED